MILFLSGLAFGLVVADFIVGAPLRRQVRDMKARELRAPVRFEPLADLLRRRLS